MNGEVKSEKMFVAEMRRSLAFAQYSYTLLLTTTCLQEEINIILNAASTDTIA
jgi:hypothetical protein